jgi:hypothetical protein
MAPSTSILGSAVRESIRIAQAGCRRKVSWAGRYMSMLDMISGQGSRDSDSTIHKFTACCRYDVSQDRVKPGPSGVVWDAWDRWMVEHWEGLDKDPGTVEMSRVRLSTYHSWFAVPPRDGQQEDKEYPPGMPSYIKRTAGIPFAHVKQSMRFWTVAHHF